MMGGILLQLSILAMLVCAAPLVVAGLKLAARLVEHDREMRHGEGYVPRPDHGQFTLKQLLVGIGLLCFELGLAAPALSGNRSNNSQLLFALSVALLCSAIGGFVGAALARE